MPIAPAVDVVRKRYNSLARIYPAFELLFALPRGIRRAAVERLRLSPGDAVLEIGCGTGRNFDHLERAVGPPGRIVGIDVAEGMLAEARARQTRHGWSNITLLHGDAMDVPLPDRMSAVLFSLSYATMKRRREILERVWARLEPGARVVVMDAKRAPGLTGRLVSAVFRQISSLTVLGDPDHAPWDDLRAVGARVDVEQWALGSYFIAVGTKMSPTG